VTWYGKGKKEPLPLNEKFRLDTEYRALITLRPLTGYTFPPSEDETVTILHSHAATTPGREIIFRISEVTNDKAETVDRIATGEITFIATPNRSNPVTDLNLNGKILAPLNGARAQTTLDATHSARATSSWAPATDDLFHLGENYTATTTLTAKLYLQRSKPKRLYPRCRRQRRSKERTRHRSAPARSTSPSGSTPPARVRR
jgi:hypothetical protein